MQDLSFQRGMDKYKEINISFLFPLVETITATYVIDPLVAHENVLKQERFTCEFLGQVVV